MKRHKILKELLISVASLALIAPLGLSSIQSASAFSYTPAQIMKMENEDTAEVEPYWKARDRKYRPILRGYHGDMDDAYDALDEYYGSLKHCPWVLDDLGRRSRVSPRWWVDHGGYEGISEMNNTLRRAINRPKGYHGPNSLRGVPFSHHHKHARHRHARKHTRRNRRHVSRRHNRKHKVNRYRHGRRHGKRNRRRRR